jgi:hypothetical protein
MPNLNLLETKPKEITYTVRCNLERVSELATMSDSYWSCYSLTRHLDETNGEVPEATPNYKANVQKFFKMVEKTNGVQTFTEKSKRYGLGRIYTDVTHNVVTLPRRIANYMCGEFYNDIDIVNCHPTIFDQVITDLHATGVLKETCPNLTKYVTSRQECFDQYNFKKHDMMKVMYSMNFKGCEFLQTINQFLLYDLYNALASKYPKIIERMEKVRREKNLKNNRDENQNLRGAVLSFVAQTYEREIACSMDRFFEAEGFTNRCMVYDGFYIDKAFTDTVALEAHIFTETGFQMKLAFKPTDDAEFNSMVREYLGEGQAVEVIHYDDYRVAAELIEAHKDEIFKFEGELWVYFENVWTKDTDRVFEMWIQECQTNIGTANKPLIVRAQTHKFKNYRTQMKNQCLLKYPNDNVQGSKLNSVKDIVPFEDGFYDARAGTYTRYEDSDEKMYFTYKIAQKIITEEFPESARKDLRQIILDIFHTEDLMREVFQFFCRALTGHFEDKLYCVFVGERNSGKGVLNDILAAAFGKAVGSFSFDEFSVRKTMESVERRRGFMSTFTHCSLAMSQEISSDAIVDSTLIKTACSGGDMIVCRKAFERLEDGGRIRALMCIFGQGIPEFTDNDAMDTMLLVNMPCKFEDKPSEENFGFVSKRANPDVKSKLKSDTMYHRMFIELVFSYYSPEKPEYKLLRKAAMDNKEQTMDEANPYLTMKNLIMKTHQYSTNSSDRVLTSVINGIVKNAPEKYKSQLKVMTSQKITNFLATLGITKTKSNGKTYFTNLKVRDEPEEDTVIFKPQTH